MTKTPMGEPDPADEDEDVRALMRLLRGDGMGEPDASESAVRRIIDHVEVTIDSNPQLVPDDIFRREVWMDRTLRVTMICLLTLPVLAIVVGALTLLLMPLFEQSAVDASCDVLMWQAHRRSILYATVSAATGLGGIALAVAIPALSGPMRRRMRIRLAVLTVALLLISSGSGTKEEEVRRKFGELESLDPEQAIPIEICRDIFHATKVLES